jgi:hypothetical protein
MTDASEGEWSELVPPNRGGEARWLAPDHPVVLAFAQAEERLLPPIDVTDWWDHPGERGRTTQTGLVGVPRQLLVTSQRLAVLRGDTVERNVAMASIGGAEVKGPPHPYLQLQDGERAVLVTSGGEHPTVWGCWSMPSEDAKGLMTDIFELAHGGPLP